MQDKIGKDYNNIIGEDYNNKIGESYKEIIEIAKTKLKNPNRRKHLIDTLSIDYSNKRKEDPSLRKRRRILEKKKWKKKEEYYKNRNK